MAAWFCRLIVGRLQANSDAVSFVGLSPVAPALDVDPLTWLGLYRGEWSPEVAALGVRR